MNGTDRVIFLDAVRRSRGQSSPLLRRAARWLLARHLAECLDKEYRELRARGLLLEDNGDRRPRRRKNRYKRKRKPPARQRAVICHIRTRCKRLPICKRCVARPEYKKLRWAQ